MIPNCSFDLHFLIISDGEYLFTCFLVMFVFFGEMSVQLFYMSLVMRILILLDQDPTTVTSFNLNYFHKDPIS